MSMSIGGAIVLACNAWNLDAESIIGEATGSMDSMAYNALHGDMAYETLLDSDPAAVVDWICENRDQTRQDMMFGMIHMKFEQFAG